MVLLACDSEQAAGKLGGRIDAVERDIAAAEAKLKATQADLQSAEERVARLRLDSTFQECRATYQSLRADVKLAAADCMQEMAATAECRAQVAQDKGKASLLGCLFGIAIAAGSAGAGTGIALAGCGAGYVAGEVGAEECPVPACVADFDQIETKVLAQAGRTIFPSCGWETGMTVQPLLASRRGMEILGVGKNGTADRAGLRIGDVVTNIRDAPTRSVQELQAAMMGTVEGADIWIQFVRDGRRFQATATAMRVDFFGDYHPYPQLAVQRSDEPAVVHFASGVKVTELAPGGAADTAGIELDDRITMVEGTPIETVEEYQDAIRFLAPGATMDLVLKRDGKRVAVTVQPPVGR